MDENRWQAYHFLFLGTDLNTDGGVWVASKNNLATTSQSSWSPKIKYVWIRTFCRLSSIENNILAFLSLKYVLIIFENLAANL
jgi:hypothetical protein